jgi:hypothetical protein
MRFTKGIEDGAKLRPKIMLANTVDELKTIMIAASRHPNYLMCHYV